MAGSVRRAGARGGGPPRGRRCWPTCGWRPCPGGHLGVLTGRSAQGTTWEYLDEFLAEHDRRSARGAGEASLRLAQPRVARRISSAASMSAGRSAGPRPAAPDRPQALGHGVLVHAQARGRAAWAALLLQHHQQRLGQPAGGRVVGGERAERALRRTPAPGRGPWSAAPAAPRRRSARDRRRGPAGAPRGAPPSPPGGWSESPRALARRPQRHVGGAAPRRAGRSRPAGAQPAIRSGAHRDEQRARAAHGRRGGLGDARRRRPRPRTPRGAGAARSAAAAGRPRVGRARRPAAPARSALRTASALRIQRSRSSA